MITAEMTFYEYEFRSCTVTKGFDSVGSVLQASSPMPHPRNVHEQRQILS